jgi:hypothetical protein
MEAHFTLVTLMEPSGSLRSQDTAMLCLDDESCLISIVIGNGCGILVFSF